MKIILEPSQKMPEHLSSPRVEIAFPHDDIGLPALIPHIRNALIAWGFHPDSVKDYIPEPE